MLPRNFSSEAIVLSRKNYGEADRIITLFTKDYGKITLIAKGVRRPKSRKRGSLEVFGIVKFSAVRGKNWHIMTEAVIVDDLKKVRIDIRRVTVAYFIVETIHKLTKDEEAHKDAYKITRYYLNKLKISTSLKKLRHAFIREIIISFGYWPRSKTLNNYDTILEEITEREMTTSRVGRKLLT
ncbi:DNA repair protein RecO [Candidatus Woesebacteria bacterium]|nr:MAG: DNA repair protein RecO [Candidatus Woesebacteria bacterium]